MSSIRNYLLLSTTHLDKPSVELLKLAALDTLLAEQGVTAIPGIGARPFPGTAPRFISAHGASYGWIVYAHDDYELLKSVGAPQTLIDIFEYARKHDCGYVMFDEDATVEPGLPTFDNE